MTLRHYICSTRRKSRRCPGKSFLVPWLLARWITWVESDGTDCKPTLQRHANLSWFSKICNHYREIAAWSRKSLTMITIFLEKRPLKGKFSKNIPKGFTTSQNHVLCANFVKFDWPEIGKVVRCLPDQKKNKTSARSPALSSRFCTDRAQNLSAAAPNNILGVPQIWSKSVHFWRSYSRTREHR